MKACKFCFLFLVSTVFLSHFAERLEAKEDSAQKIGAEQFYKELHTTMLSASNHSMVGSFSIAEDKGEEPKTGSFTLCRYPKKNFVQVLLQLPDSLLELKWKKDGAKQWRTQIVGEAWTPWLPYEVSATQSVEGFTLATLQYVMWGGFEKRESFLFKDEMHYRKEISLPWVDYTLSPKTTRFALERIHYRVQVDGHFKYLQSRVKNSSKRIVFEAEKWSQRSSELCQ